MAKSKQVVLFLVEGRSEQFALEGVLDSLSSDIVLFHVINSDITSDKDTTTNNVKEKITAHIKNFIDERKIPKESILKVIHLVDTDGAYIPDANIIVDKSLTKFVYSLTDISANSHENVSTRNQNKRKILDMLVSTKTVFKNLSYEVYYFSCNLDHVLYDEINLAEGLKTKKADEFYDRYFDKSDEFVDFICNSPFSVHGSYVSTWDFIKIGLNSLNRYTNFNVYLASVLDQDETP